jgi:branched-chain amino acid transport system substrate-binding protein
VFVPSGGADFNPNIEQLLAQRPQVVYSSVITSDAAKLVAQGRPLGLFEKTHFFGIMDYGTLAAMPKPPLGVTGYTNYPSAAIYQTPFASELESLGTSVANSGAAGDAYNQIELIAQGVEKADSTDPAKVRDALAGSQVQTVQGTVRVERCNHVLAVPIAMGTVAGPSATQPFAHLEPLTLVPTSRYFEC